MNIARALTLEGFMDCTELEYLATVASKSKLILECGSWKGRSATAMAENTSGLIYCVDTFRGDPKDEHELNIDVFSGFMENTEPLTNVLPIPLSSERASAIFKRAGIRFDLIFIDASHDFESVTRDITVWRELLAHGAILCGHDYGNTDWPEVKQAVDKLIPNFRVVGSIWTTEEA